MHTKIGALLNFLHDYSTKAIEKGEPSLCNCMEDVALLYIKLHTPYLCPKLLEIIIIIFLNFFKQKKKEACAFVLCDLLLVLVLQVQNDILKSDSSITCL